VFIDGVYVPPPYKIVQAEDKVTINEQPILYPTPRQEPRRGPFENVHSTALDLASQLDAGAAIVAWNETPCVTLFGMRSTQLLRLLTSERNAKDTQELLTALPSDIDRRIWEAWLRDYEATDNFLARAELALEEIEQLEAAGAQAVNSVTRLRTLAYPLTMFGMVLAVFSLGHLLQCPPRGPDELKPSRRRAALCRATIVSLALIAAFSGLDLVWTLLASGAGQMTELNPIGSHLLRNPLHLSLFKITATVVSCGLLMYLRQHQRAQLATWWMCLVCTVLTFRWLVLNSMFIT
jgi:hypothetical protein